MEGSLLQWQPDERIIRECGKMVYLDRLLVKFFRTGHRVLLFATMTKQLDLMEAYLKWRTIDGTAPTFALLSFYPASIIVSICTRLGGATASTLPCSRSILLSFHLASVTIDAKGTTLVTLTTRFFSLCKVK